MDDDFQKTLLLELECPICSNYMAPPIRQCSTGHSICEGCMQKLRACALCQSEFTQARNLSLESLAARLQYPCSNDGCKAKLTLTNREYHERNCGFRNYKCPAENCDWSGTLKDISQHWEDKKLCKAYKSNNLCHTKVMNNMSFINLVEAHNEKFWYKCKIVNGFVFFAVQLIGQADKSEGYNYEIEIFKPGHLKRRLVLGDYCQSVHLEDEQMFKLGGSCAYISIDSLNNFIGIDKMLIYNLRVFFIPNRTAPREQNPQTNPFAQSNFEGQNQYRAAPQNKHWNNKKGPKKPQKP